MKEKLTFVGSQIEAGKILSAWSVGFGGVGEVWPRWLFGNGIGAKVTMDKNSYEYAYGSILVECEGTLEYPHAELLGFTVKWGDSTESECRSTNFIRGQYGEIRGDSSGRDRNTATVMTLRTHARNVRLSGRGGGGIR